MAQPASASASYPGSPARRIAREVSSPQSPTVEGGDVLDPLRTNLVLRGALVVRRRDHRLGALDADHHDRLDGAGRPSRSVERQELVEARPRIDHGSAAPETVALAHDRVDHVD